MDISNVFFEAFLIVRLIFTLITKLFYPFFKRSVDILMAPKIPFCLELFVTLLTSKQLLFFAILFVVNILVASEVVHSCERFIATRAGKFRSAIAG